MTTFTHAENAFQEPFKVILFSHDTEYGPAALAAGCTALVVDWECHDKERRQAGCNTEINRVGPDSLSQMRKATRGRLICRINNMPSSRRAETRIAADLGADEILLPMVRSLSEVEECLDVLQGRIPLGVQVETQEGLQMGEELRRLPLSRVYIGLNDLYIDRGRNGHLFTPLVDGSLDTFRKTFSGPLGVAGITVPNRGEPVPQRLLLAAMARLECGFGVARRAFRKDVPITSLAIVLEQIQETYAALRLRPIQQIPLDREALDRRIQELLPEASLI